MKTADDGKPFMKLDGEKVQLQLLSFSAIEEVGKVLTYGAKKYQPNNWRRGAEWSRHIGAALRHMFAFAKGENTDPESGVSHLAHAMCCLMFLMEFQLRAGGVDDRVLEVAVK